MSEYVGINTTRQIQFNIRMKINMNTNTRSRRIP